MHAGLRRRILLTRQDIRAGVQPLARPVRIPAVNEDRSRPTRRGAPPGSDASNAEPRPSLILLRGLDHRRFRLLSPCRQPAGLARPMVSATRAAPSGAKARPGPGCADPPTWYR